MESSLKTIDDVIRIMENFLIEVNKNIGEKELDRAVAGILASAKDPDEVFKARLVSSYMEDFVRIRIKLGYLAKNVSKEGIMQQKSNGTVELEGEVISDGTSLECLKNDAWHYGVLRQDRQTKKYHVTNWKGDVEIERIEQLMTRIRE